MTSNCPIVQVLEMYSSGGDLHLELPSGGHEADTAVWQIPPYHTKQVMRANFLARAESNHTAYIRWGLTVFNQFIVRCYVDWGASVFTDLTPSRINIKFHFAHNVLWLLKVYISCNAFDKISMDIEAQLHNTDLRWRWGNGWEMMTQQLTLRLQFNCTTLLKYPELINNLEIYNSPITLAASHPDLRVF